MTPMVFRPSRKYLHKMYIEFVLLGLFFTGLSMTLGFHIGQLLGGVTGQHMGVLIGGLVHLLWLLPAIVLIYPYYRSLFYEIHNEEVIMHVGVITRTVKHVPFRTVTTLEVKRGPLDRLFGLATIDIQTAGVTDQSGAEESLVGLLNFKKVYDTIKNTLHRFRYTRDTIDADERNNASEYDKISMMLEEIREIRHLLEFSSYK